MRQLSRVHIPGASGAGPLTSSVPCTLSLFRPIVHPDICQVGPACDRPVYARYVDGNVTDNVPGRVNRLLARAGVGQFLGGKQFAPQSPPRACGCGECPNLFHRILWNKSPPRACGCGCPTPDFRRNPAVTGRGPPGLPVRCRPGAGCGKRIFPAIRILPDPIRNGRPRSQEICRGCAPPPESTASAGSAREGEPCNP